MFLYHRKSPELQPIPLIPKWFQFISSTSCFLEHCWLPPPGRFLLPMPCLLPVSSARLLISILFLLGMNRGAQCSFEINNSVFFRGGGESLAPLWGDKTLPGVPLGTSHHTSAQKRWKQKGGAVFPFLTADWKACLPSSLISHSLTAPNASAVAVVSQVATRDCNREMEGEEPDSYSSREKRRLLSASCSKADQKTRLTFQRDFQFL